MVISHGPHSQRQSFSRSFVEGLSSELRDKQPHHMSSDISIPTWRRFLTRNVSLFLCSGMLTPGCHRMQGIFLLPECVTEHWSILGNRMFQHRPRDEVKSRHRPLTMSCSSWAWLAPLTTNDQPPMRWLSRCHSSACSWLGLASACLAPNQTVSGLRCRLSPPLYFPYPRIFSLSPLVKHRHRASCASEGLEECSTHSVMLVKSQTRLNPMKQGDSCLIDNRLLTMTDLRTPTSIRFYENWRVVGVQHSK